MLHRSIVLGFAAGVLLLAGGCRGEPVATVTGNVIYKGKPLPGGTLTFLSEDNTKQEIVPIRGDGRYTAGRVPTGKVLVGVQPAGKKRAALIKGNTKDLSRPPKDSGMEKAEPKTEGQYTEIPAHLRSPATSRITLVVDASEKTFDITLPER